MPWKMNTCKTRSHLPAFVPAYLSLFHSALSAFPLCLFLFLSPRFLLCTVDKSNDQEFFLVCLSLNWLTARYRYNTMKSALTECQPSSGIQFAMVCQQQCRGQHDIQMVILQHAHKLEWDVFFLFCLTFTLSRSHSLSLSRSLSVSLINQIFWILVCTARYSSAVFQCRCTVVNL